jgi:hypothetical protein
MKLFACPACHEIVYFENTRCTHCGHELAFVSEIGALTALEAAPGLAPGTYRSLDAGMRDALVRKCGNDLDYAACNWAVPDSDPHRFCLACRLNEVIPNLSDANAKGAWIRIEQAKRRLIYQLLALGLPVEPRQESPRGLAFAFKEDVPGGEKVLIGQENGLITLNIAEADSPFREKTRLSLGESYRTLLGHFRHEIGHYYFERIVADSPFLGPFRDLFGDERASYEEAVARHYREGARPDWPAHFVSSYATMHPHEDWAETWAHYLHMADTLETARTLGISMRAEVDRRPKLAVESRKVDFNDFDHLVEAWIPLTIALNNLNRSMGLRDLYPFVLPELALRKIRFVHDVIEKSGAKPG